MMINLSTQNLNHQHTDPRKFHMPSYSERTAWKTLSSRRMVWKKRSYISKDHVVFGQFYPRLLITSTQDKMTEGNCLNSGDWDTITAASKLRKTQKRTETKEDSTVVTKNFSSSRGVNKTSKTGIEKNIAVLA